MKTINPATLVMCAIVGAIPFLPIIKAQEPGNVSANDIDPNRTTASGKGVLPLGSSQIITVTTLNDVSDFSGSQQVTDLPGPDGRVSFREAVTAANNTTGPQTIAFAIPTSEFWLVTGVALLRLEEGPFVLTDSETTIDFSTQTANIGDTNPNGPEVGIYGLQPNGLGAAAIFINGNNSLIKGLGNVYQRGYAVQIVGNNNQIVSCQIDGPLHAAVSINGYIGGPTPSGNIIGGTAPGDGNTLIGLNIDGPADDNIVVGNSLLVGVQVRGATRYGVFARNNRIGGPTSAERNLISGAGHYGEEGLPTGTQVSVVDADGTVVEGNYIGTNAQGTAAYPQIGPGGVGVVDSRGTTVRGNLIAGLRAIGTNHYAGQIFGQAVYVTPINDNIADTLIEDNTIGLAADEVTPILTHSGVTVSPALVSHHASGTIIRSNHIATVETTGVAVSSFETGVTITGNSIHDCGSLGIDLFSTSGGGVTPNDPGDGDTGGNRLQNFPEILSAVTSGATISLQGTFESLPSEQFKLEFFASASCDPSGFGEGALYIGSTTVTTDGNGHAAFSATFPGTVAVNDVATATATRVSTGDTSEFSACTIVTFSAATPVPTATATATASATATATATPVVTSTPFTTPTPNVTPTPGGTGTPMPTATATSTATPVSTTTPAQTSTPTPTAPTKVVNLSTRMRVQTGDDVGIGGFIVTGSSPENLVIRGIGPSLTDVGIPNALPDPILELHGPGAFATITNDNWRESQEAAIQATGLSPRNDLESVIMVTLTPGAYTAVLKSNDGSSGVALVEVYDLGQDVASKLANLSTRAFVSTGDSAVIAGVMLSGNEMNDRIVLRGIGPSLAESGLAGVLQDPRLELRDSNGILLIANNDWQDDNVQAAEITAAGLAPTNRVEAAVAAELPPGLYTALLTGTNSGTGLGVIEVYDRGSNAP